MVKALFFLKEKCHSQRKVPSLFSCKKFHGRSCGQNNAPQFAYVSISISWVPLRGTHTFFPDGVCLAMQFSELLHMTRISQLRTDSSPTRRKHCIFALSLATPRLFWAAFQRRKMAPKSSRIEKLSDSRMFATASDRVVGNPWRTKQ